MTREAPDRYTDAGKRVIQNRAAGRPDLTKTGEARDDISFEQMTGAPLGMNTDAGKQKSYWELPVVYLTVVT